MKAPHQRTSTRARSARQASATTLPPSAAPIPSSTGQPRNHDAKLTRVRLQPYQLEVLKKEYAKDQNPSMEKRMEIGVEVDMHVSRVTNWFRNLRQSEKTKKKPSSGAAVRKSEVMDDDEADDATTASSSVPVPLPTVPSHLPKGRVTRNSQSTPEALGPWYEEDLRARSTSYVEDEDMDMDDNDNDDEDEDDELATPEPVTPPQHPHRHHNLPSLVNLIHPTDEHPTLPPLHSIPGYTQPRPLIQVTNQSTLPLPLALPHSSESAVSVRSPDYYAAEIPGIHQHHPGVSDSYADFNKEDKEGALLLLHFAGKRIMPNFEHPHSHSRSHGHGHGLERHGSGRLVHAL